MPLWKEKILAPYAILTQGKNSFLTLDLAIGMLPNGKASPSIQEPLGFPSTVTALISRMSGV